LTDFGGSINPCAEAIGWPEARKQAQSAIGDMYFMRLNRTSAKGKGFTLIEMVVVVAIVGILAGAAMPFVRYGEQRIKERELRQSLREIRIAIDAYRKASVEGMISRKVGASGYPPTLEVLVEGVVDAKNVDSQKIYFLRRIPRDPFAPPETGIKEMWGLRSYASPANEPKAGDDVYDVYSKNQGVGSNGAKYRDW